MDGSFRNFEGMSGMAQTTSDSILGVIRQESWILHHFEILVTTALKEAYRNRCQSEDGDATWRISLPWWRYLRSLSAFSSYVNGEIKKWRMKNTGEVCLRV